jgi:hypothetical protein
MVVTSLFGSATADDVETTPTRTAGSTAKFRSAVYPGLRTTPELPSGADVDGRHPEAPSMTRSAALRAGTIFVLLALFFGATGINAYAPLAEALFLITGSLCALMLLFGLAPRPAAVPVRVKRRTH